MSEAAISETAQCRKALRFFKILHICLPLGKGGLTVYHTLVLAKPAHDFGYSGSAARLISNSAKRSNHAELKRFGNHIETLVNQMVVYALY